MPNKTKSLPATRVSEALYEAVQTVAIAQDVPMSEVIRLALLDYCMPKFRPVVPIIGALHPDMDWDQLGLEFKKAKKEFQSQVEALVLAGEGEG